MMTDNRDYPQGIFLLVFLFLWRKFLLYPESKIFLFFLKKFIVQYIFWNIEKKNGL